MKQVTDQRPTIPWAIVSGLSLFLIVGLTIPFGHPQWLVNDDQAMESFASGSYTGTPDSNLVFVSRSLGLIFQHLYSLQPVIPWYAIVMVGTSMLGLFLFALTLSRALTRVGWLLSALPLFIWLCMRPNFTATALLAGFTSVVTLAWAARRPKARLPFVIVLSILGSMWRFDSWLLGMFLGLPILLFALRPRVCSHSIRIISLLALAVICLGWLGSATVSNSCIGESEQTCASWHEYESFNVQRGAFHGSPRMALLLASEKTGWVPETGALFANFVYGDSPVFGPTVLAEVDKSVPTVLQLYGGSVSKHVAYEVSYHGNLLGWLLVALISSLIPSLFFVKRPIRYFAKVILFSGIWFLGIFAVTLIRDPEAIIATAIGLFGLGLLAISQGEEFDSSVSPTRSTGAIVSLVLAAMFACTLAAFGVRGWFPLRSAGIAMERYSLNALQNIDSIAPAKRIFGAGIATGIFAHGPFEILSGRVAQPLLSGWPVFSPSFKIRKEALGFPEDLYAGFLQTPGGGADNYESKQVLLGTSSDAAFTAGFMANQLGLNPRILPILLGEVNQDFGLWSFKVVTPGNPGE